MSKLCSKCHYLGQPKQPHFFANFYFGLGFVIGGLIIYLGGSNYGNFDLIRFIVAVIFFLIAAISFRYYAKGSVICPKCGNKNMLPLDDAEALKLIKEYDLRPGENAVDKNEQESESTSPSQTT